MSIEDIENPELADKIRHKLARKTKPLGSLGVIESLALRIGLILGTDSPALIRPQVLVCAGDHGLAAQGVSAYPSDVTWQMVENFLAGGAAISVLARQHGLALTVVDCGVAHDFTATPGLLIRKVVPGTRDSSRLPAMTDTECVQAMVNGADVLRSLPGNVVLLGEMGIGNTSAASLLMSRLTGAPIEQCVGAGTGLTEEGVLRKVTVLRHALERNKTSREPLAALADLGGFEIATLVGVILEAAKERRVIVVDGFITGAAVLVAAGIAPSVLQRCVFSHCSSEKGHRLMLRHLAAGQEEAARPLLDLGLRLGEGSGAALAWPLLQSACLLLDQMASFDAASVAEACSS